MNDSVSEAAAKIVMWLVAADRAGDRSQALEPMTNQAAVASQTTMPNADLAERASPTSPPHLANAGPGGHNGRTMPLSARNQFVGTIVSIKGGSVMCEVVIDIGGHQIVSLISASSAKRLKLKKGGQAVAVIKATEVIVSTDFPADES